MLKTRPTVVTNKLVEGSKISSEFVGSSVERKGHTFREVVVGAAMDIVVWTGYSCWWINGMQKTVEYVSML